MQSKIPKIGEDISSLFNDKPQADKSASGKSAKVPAVGEDISAWFVAPEKVSEPGIPGTHPRAGVTYGGAPVDAPEKRYLGSEGSRKGGAGPVGKVSERVVAPPMPPPPVGPDLPAAAVVPAQKSFVPVPYAERGPAGPGRGISYGPNDTAPKTTDAEGKLLGPEFGVPQPSRSIAQTIYEDAGFKQLLTGLKDIAIDAGAEMHKPWLDANPDIREMLKNLRGAEPGIGMHTLSAGSDVLEGGFRVAEPIFAIEAAAKPLLTAAILAAGVGGQKAAEKATRALGGDEETSRFVGNLGALIGGAIGAKVTARVTMNRRVAGSKTAKDADAAMRREAADTLGVDPHASPEEIRFAWINLAKEFHPDKPGAKAMDMADINAARDWLIDHPSTSAPTEKTSLADWAKEQLEWLKAKLRKPVTDEAAAAAAEGSASKEISGRTEVAPPAAGDVPVPPIVPVPPVAPSDPGAVPTVGTGKYAPIQRPEGGWPAPAPPVAAAPTPPPTTAPEAPVVAAPPAAPAEPGIKAIGQNSAGQTVFEDANGIRSVVEGGVRQTEPVRLEPTREGMIARPRDTRDPQFEIASPETVVPDAQPEFRAEQLGGYDQGARVSLQGDDSGRDVATILEPADGGVRVVFDDGQSSVVDPQKDIAALVGEQTLADRLQAIKDAREKLAGDLKASESGVSGAIRSNEKGNLEVAFTGKPEQSVIDTLKRLGFRWNKGDKVWYAKETPSRKAALMTWSDFRGLFDQAPVPAADVPPVVAPPSEPKVAPAVTPEEVPREASPVVERPRRNAVGSQALEDALSPKAQGALAQMFQKRNAARDLRHIRAAMEVYDRLLQQDKDGSRVLAATESYFTHAANGYVDGMVEAASDLDDAVMDGLRDLTGESDPDPNNELLENEVFASAVDAGRLVFDTLDPKTASFDIEEFNTAFGEVEFRKPQEEVFPVPEERVNYHTELTNKGDLLTQAQANDRIESWKRRAKEIGATEDHANETIMSLFDVTGTWSQPWRDAGYNVVQFDIKNGDDLMDFGAWMARVEEEIAEGRPIVGVIGGPPCTSFAVSGAQWWKSQHDVESTEMVEKKYGTWATQFFKRPIDYANTLVAVMKMIVEQSNPQFYAMENPVGRIAEQNALPKPTLTFDPSNFGDPYTKQTQLWGEFNPHLPTANVEPTLGSLVHKLRGDVEEQKAKRSETPPGFAYAFFIAQHERLMAAAAEAPLSPDAAAEGTPHEPEGVDALGQLPEREPGTPEPVRAAGEGPLAPVRPETVGATPEAGATSAGHGDSESGVATGVPHASGDGEHGIAARPSGGALSGRAVDPAGDLGFPGGQPLDYDLSDERIRGIIDRGDVTRLADNIAALKIVKEVTEAQRFATLEEQHALAKYVGWGAGEMAQFLEEAPRYNWSDNQRRLWQELRDMTTEKERAAIAASTPNAHFTFDIYKPIWAALERAGFSGGRVLEPAIGSGHALGFMPPQLRAASTINASELEPITAAIAQMLYPSARVQSIGFEKIRLPHGTQDIAISNVPFGPYGVVDSRFGGDREFLTKSIHSYFFAKALDFMRPGGLVAFISSRYTLDGPDSERLRKYLMQHAEFVGAVRLPNTSFKKSAKTEVVTDLIVLRKLHEGEVAQNAAAFIASPEVPEFTRTEYGRRGAQETKKVFRSQWYADHPELVLGDQSLEGSMYSSGEYTVTATTDNLNDALSAALEKVLPPGTYEPARKPIRIQAPSAVADAGTFKPGEFRVVDGRIAMVDRDGNIVDATPTRKSRKTGEMEVDETAVKRLTGMIGIRDALRATIAEMSNPDASDAQIEKRQKELSRIYKAFVKQHGTLNARANKSLFKNDPESTNLLGLEKIEATGSIYKDKAGKETLRVQYEVKGLSDIFTKRTINAPRVITHVETAQDALLASLGTRTYIDWDYMAKIADRSVEDLQRELRNDGRAYEMPNGAWMTADEFLSGDVVTRLADVRAAHEENRLTFAAELKALEAVQPTPRTAEQIDITFGQNWIPRTDIVAFLKDTLGTTPSIALSQTASMVHWALEWDARAVQAGRVHPLAVAYGPGKEHGASKIYGLTDLIDDALNMGQPDLGHDEKMSNGSGGTTTKYIRDVEATMAARANLDEVRNLWTDWLIDHPDVHQRLVDLNNERFNRTVPRTFDGAHLQQSLRDNGLALPFDLHPHQLNAIYRALATGNTLLAHEVGAGKTYEVIAIMMEMRRTGRATKPMVTVPTHLLGDWKEAVIKAYPKAKVLTFDESDLSSQNRQQAMARIAFGDWDMVLVPHSSFELLNVSPKRMAEVMQEWVDELVEAEKEAKRAKGKDPDSVKKMASIRKKIETKIEKLLEKKSTDNALTWEDLGVDALAVDEAHAFKNLYFMSKIDNIRGLSKSTSNRSLDMFVKIKAINEASNYRNVVLATATPVMNSMAEIFTMQRYLQPQVLRQAGLENFDNWYAMFANAMPTTEQRPDGTYHEVTRLKKFKNLKILYGQVSQVMDYIGWEDMPYLKLPKFAGGKIDVVQIPAHPVYPMIQKWLTRRLANVRDMPPHVDRRTGDYIAPLRPDPFTGEPMLETDPKKIAKMGKFKKDNILTIMNDAGKAAIDVRLVLGDKAKDVPESRIQTAAKQIAEAYKAGAKGKDTSLVFLDVGTPKNPAPLEFLKGVDTLDETEGGALGVEDETVDEDDLIPDDDEGEFNLYDALKDLLVKRGIPAREIAYIHQARNNAERLALFEAARTGKVRVLIASTDKGGTGMNIQRRLRNMFELDVPRAKRPGDIRQRLGRAVRQGNEHPEVYIKRYVTKGSTDEWLYGLIGAKSDTIQKFMRGDADTFTDEDPTTMSVEEAQVRASGDPRGIELTELRSQVGRLTAQAAAVDRAHTKAKKDIVEATARQENYERHLESAKAWLASSYAPVSSEKFAMRAGGVDYTVRKDANAAIIQALQQVADTYNQQGATVGQIGGLDIRAKVDYVRDVVVWLDGKPLGYHDIPVTEIARASKSGELGAGRDIVASVVDAYKKVPALADQITRIIDNARAEIANAERALAAKNDAQEKARAAKLRITQLEEELKSEGIARDAVSSEEVRLEKQRKASGGGVNDAWISEPSTGGGASSQPSKKGSAPKSWTIKDLQGIEYPELVMLARDLIKVPQIKRSLGRALGRFRGDIIQLRADLFKPGREQELAAVLAHELGHLIDYLPHGTMSRGNLVGRLRSLHRYMKNNFTDANGHTIRNPEIKKELVALSEVWRPWDRDAAEDAMRRYRDSARELYADALSALLNSPGFVEEVAPTFYKAFFDGLDQKPEVESAYQGIQELMSRTREELVDKRSQGIREMFAAGNKKALDLHREQADQAKRDRRNFGFHLRRLFLDKNTPIIDRIAELESRGVRVNEDDNPLYALEERNYLGGLQKAFIERTIVPVYDRVLKSGATWDDVGEALFNTRISAGDRLGRANPRGITPAAATELQERLQERLGQDRYSVVMEAVQAIRDAGAELVAEAHREGMLTDEVYEGLQANPAYAPFRIVQHMSTDVGWGVKSQVGTHLDAGNPADAYVLKMLSTIRAIERQKMTVTTLDFLKQHFPGDIVRAKTRWTGKTHEPLEPSDETQGLVRVYENGLVKGYYVDQYIAESIHNESIGRNKAVMAGLNLITGAPLFRPLFTTFNPAFQIWNFQRDFMRFWKNTPDMTVLQALRLYRKVFGASRFRAGLNAKATQADMDRVIDAEQAKMLSVTYNDLSHGRELSDTEIEDIFARTGVSDHGKEKSYPPVVREVVKVLNFIKAIGDVVETLPKLAGIEHFSGGKGALTLTPLQRSFVRKMIGTPDLLAGGTWTPATNKLFLYSNAAAQGTRTDLQMMLKSGAKEMPKLSDGSRRASGVWWKTVSVNVLPKVLMYLALAGVFGEAVRRILQKGSTSYDRTNYIVLPLGEDDRGNGVVMRVPQDQFGQLISGLVWKTLQLAGGDKDVLSSLSEIFDYTGGQLPSVSPGIEGATNLGTYLSGRNIHESFRGMDVLTDQEQAARPYSWKPFKKYMGWQIQQLGASVFWKFYAGAEKPPTGSLEWFVQLPIISPIVGRMVRVTSYGETEALRDEAKRVGGVEAALTLDARDAVRAAVSAVKGVPAEARAKAIAEQAKRIVEETYPDLQPAQKRDKFTDIQKRIRLGSVRAATDPVVEALFSAQTIDQKVAVLLKAAEGQPPQEFQFFLNQLVREGVLSAPARGRIQQALVKSGLWSKVGTAAPSEIVK